MQLKSNSNIFTAEINPYHCAIGLIRKMLEYKHEDRISSGDVVIQLKTIKLKVIILYERRGKNRRSWIGHDQNLILKSIN